MNSQFVEGACMECRKLFYEQIDETDHKRSYAFFVCPDCKYEYVDLVCLKCNNCDFINDLASRPLSWTCDECGTVVEFKTDMYQHPEKLYRFEELPQEAQWHFEKEKIKERNHMRLIYAYILLPPVLLLVMFLIDKLQK